MSPARVDPYASFRFRVKWDGRYVAGASLVRAPAARDGSTPGESRGSSRRETVRLERGVAHDPEFQRWLSQPEASPGDLRTDIVIERFDEAGRLALAYTIRRCRVSEVVALPDLDARTDALAFESIGLEHEGWERDSAASGAKSDVPAEPRPHPLEPDVT